MIPAMAYFFYSINDEGHLHMINSEHLGQSFNQASDVCQWNNL